MGSPDYINWPTNGPYFDLQNPLAQGCVGAWCFNKSWYNGLIAYDQTSRNNGLLTAMDPATDWTPQGLDFDGVNDHVVVRDDKILAEEFASTVIVVFKTTAVARSGGRSIYAERAASGNNIWKLDSLDPSSPNSVFFTHRNDGGLLTRIRTTKIINDGIIHAVAMTKFGKAIKIYVDGVLDASGTLGGSDTFTNAGIESWLGGDRGDSNANYVGKIANFAIWDRRLIADEIAQLAADPLRLFRRKEVAHFFPSISTGNRRRKLLIGA